MPRCDCHVCEPVNEQAKLTKRSGVKRWLPRFCHGQWLSIDFDGERAVEGKYIAIQWGALVIELNLGRA